MLTKFAVSTFCICIYSKLVVPFCSEPVPLHYTIPVHSYWSRPWWWRNSCTELPVWDCSTTLNWASCSYTPGQWNAQLLQAALVPGVPVACALGEQSQTVPCTYRVVIHGNLQFGYRHGREHKVLSVKSRHNSSIKGVVANNRV